MSPDWIQSFTHWITGDVAAGSGYVLSRWIFLRLLGVVYLIAFVSLWVQVKGLIGTNGILPVAEFLNAMKANYGTERYWLVPTVLWINASDMALHVVCGLGALGSLALILGLAPMPSLIVLWVLYLSLTTVGRDFLSFQWDVLLLEVGLLAIFFAPSTLIPNVEKETVIPIPILLLLWWLAFRFMFESGVVKLNAGDRTWTDLTALTYHYFSQPIPTWTAWFVHHAPLWFHKLSTVVMYTVELVLPFFIFFGHIPRLITFLGYLFLMIIITATGNYNFFTLLTVALAVPLVPDAFWLRVMPSGFVEWLGYPGVHPALAQRFAWLTVAVAIIYLLVSGSQLLRTINRGAPIPRFIDRLEDIFQPLRSISAYGLFRVMTKDRPEIIVEGSNDGKSWKAYEFKYKPGRLDRAPPFVEPHQPRLDWQMWFAALSSFERTPWFQAFMAKLLQGSPDVLELLAKNPFPDAPPKYLRARFYHFEFTSPKEKRATGNWWRRTEKWMYSPMLSLQ